jgi:hypothetical protein
MTAYREVLIQTYVAEGEQSSKKIRARPVPGQGDDLTEGMHVECSAAMRKGHPPGSYFLIRAKVTDRDDGARFLYTSFRWPYQLLTPEAARQFLNAGGWR